VKKDYAAADLAILEIRDKSICDSATWPATTGQTTNLLQTAGADGKLVRIAASGSVGQIPVSIVSYDSEQVVVAPPQQIAIVSGWSGSGLYVRDALAGILLSTNTETGRGTVLRVDYVERIIDPFMNPPAVATDPFIRDISSGSFHDRLSQIVAALIADRLEQFKTNEYTVVTTDRTVASYYSNLQLPGFDKPGTLDFHNNAAYTKPMKLDKHPVNLVYTQDFGVLSSLGGVKKARVQALADAVGSVVPSSWTTNTYSDHNEYLGDGAEIRIDFGLDQIVLKFVPRR
jgi:hypothetical protein